LGVRVADDKELLAADVVFVATPPAALNDVAAALKGYAGIIVSAMVPGAGGYELKRDDRTSAAEQLARLVPKGRAVAAFTSISSALIRDPASGEKPTVFTCTDDEAARSIVIAPAKEIGFEGVDAGHLDASRNIETSASSWDSLLTDQASKTALRCALMQHREPFEEKVQLYRNGEAVYARLSRLYLPECKRSEGTGDILERYASYSHGVRHQAPHRVPAIPAPRG
jgi:predicted dinucleotide-binding enzyme